MNNNSIAFQGTIAREQLIHAGLSHVVKTGLVKARWTVATNVRVVPTAIQSTIVS